MKYIVSLEPEGEGWTAGVADGRGYFKKVPFADVFSARERYRQDWDRVRVTLNLADLVPISAQRYAELSGLPEQICGQIRAYEVSIKGSRYAIPAQLLILPLLVGSKHIVPFLMRSHGLATLCYFYNDPAAEPGTPPELKFDPSSVVCKAAEVAHIRDKLVWVRAFPSAHRFWRSVLEFAHSGRFGAVLPKCTIDCTIQVARSVGSVHLVNNLNLYTLRPNECPFSGLEGFDDSIFKFSEITFDSRVSTLDPEIAHLDFSNGLSDEEWWLVEPLLRIKVNHSDSANTRAMVSLALHRTATGTHWKTDTIEGNRLAHSARACHSKLLKLGRWKEITDLLVSYRGASVQGRPNIAWFRGRRRPLTTKQLAQMSGLTVKNVQAWIDNGFIRASKIGYYYWIDSDSLLFRLIDIKSQVNIFALPIKLFVDREIYADKVIRRAFHDFKADCFSRDQITGKNRLVLSDEEWRLVAPFVVVQPDTPRAIRTRQRIADFFAIHRMVPDVARNCILSYESVDSRKLFKRLEESGDWERMWNLAESYRSGGGGVEASPST